MAEYIRKDVLTRVYMEKGKDKLRLATVINELEMLPAADVAPIIRGHWIPEHHKDKVSRTEYHSYTWYHCSVCGRKLIGCRDPLEAPYCHCGAKMDLMEDA